MFSNIDVESDALFVRHGNIWSSAGVTAGMDLALALVREDLGNDVALAVARRHVMFLIRPGGQSQFSSHLAAEARRCMGVWMDFFAQFLPHVNEHLDIPTLASRPHMSERNFARNLQKDSGKTPASYIEEARIDEARRLLTSTSIPIAAIALRAGFISEERMRRTFQRNLKVSPAAYRARFK